MRKHLIPIAVAVLGLSACTQVADTSNVAASGPRFAIYKNPNGYCRMAQEDSDFENTLRRQGSWSFAGSRDSSDSACKAMRSMCARVDDRSCNPPT